MNYGKDRFRNIIFDGIIGTVILYNLTISCELCLRSQIRTKFGPSLEVSYEISGFSKPHPNRLFLI